MSWFCLLESEKFSAREGIFMYHGGRWMAAVWTGVVAGEAGSERPKPEGGSRKAEGGKRKSEVGKP